MSTRRPNPEDDLAAVDLGPAPRMEIGLHRDERKIRSQASFENDLVRLLLTRYRLDPVIRSEDQDTGQPDLQSLCAYYRDLPLFLSVLKLSKTEQSKITLPAFLGSPVPEQILVAMEDLVSVRDGYEDERPVGVVVPFPGLRAYRNHATGKTVSVGRCSAILYYASYASEAMTLSDDEGQPPILQLALDDSEYRLRIQSLASWIYQLDMAKSRIF